MIFLFNSATFVTSSLLKSSHSTSFSFPQKYSLLHFRAPLHIYLFTAQTTYLWAIGSILICNFSSCHFSIGFCVFFHDCGYSFPLSEVSSFSSQILLRTVRRWLLLPWFRSQVDCHCCQSKQKSIATVFSADIFSIPAWEQLSIGIQFLLKWKLLQEQ